MKHTVIVQKKHYASFTKSLSTISLVGFVVKTLGKMPAKGADLTLYFEENADEAVTLPACVIKDVAWLATRFNLTVTSGPIEAT